MKLTGKYHLFFWAVFLLGSALISSGCRSARQAAPEPPQTEQEQPTPQRPAQADPDEEMTRLPGSFIDQAYREYARKANRKLTLFFQAQQQYSGGSYGEALTLINKAIEIERSADALALKGLIYYALEAYDQAEKMWEEALALDSTVFERIILQSD